MKLGPERFATEHHVDCRPNLAACTIDRMLAALDGPPQPPGYYEVWWELGQLRFEQIASTDEVELP